MITVPASLMSSFLGRHKYRSQDEAIKEIYERYVAKTYECIDVTLPDELVPLVTQRCLSETDYKVTDKLEPLSAKKGDVEIKVNATQQLAIARGIALENTALEELNEMLAVQGSGMTVRPHSSVHVKEVDGVTIVGQVDGLIYDDDDNLVGVVEIKNRLRGFFNEAKLESYKYDIDQLMCYHQLFLKSRPATHMLVQCYNGKLQVTTYDGQYMETRWNNVLPQLTRAISRYHQLLDQYTDEDTPTFKSAISCT